MREMAGDLSVTDKNRRTTMAGTEIDTQNEDELDGCGHEIDDADITPDEDLPAAVGGVE